MFAKDACSNNPGTHLEHPYLTLTPLIHTRVPCGQSDHRQRWYSALVIVSTFAQSRYSTLTTFFSSLSPGLLHLTRWLQCLITGSFLDQYRLPPHPGCQRLDLPAGKTVPAAVDRIEFQTVHPRPGQ